MPNAPHGAGCLCSSCHLSSNLFPRGPNDIIILPPIRPIGIRISATPHVLREDRGTPHRHGNRPTRTAALQQSPLRPQSTPPGQHRHFAYPPPPAPARIDISRTMPRKRAESHRAGPINGGFGADGVPSNSLPNGISSHSTPSPQHAVEVPETLKWVERKEARRHFIPQGRNFMTYVPDGVPEKR
ncbi:hypothetical protein C8J57DRAFT_1228157 [Mycena rebaudengoi]|nr:hypothetical protein C8J57DRAFT_1228157 [Mycena rebaudengoi]